MAGICRPCRGRAGVVSLSKPRKRPGSLLALRSGCDISDIKIYLEVRRRSGAAARIDLPLDQSFHETGGAGAHPIDGVNVLLSGSFGGHFARVLAERGIQTAITEKTNPIEAIRDFLARHAAGTLLPVAGCDCGSTCHGEAHDHDHPRAAAQEVG